MIKITEKRFVFDPSIYHFTDTKTGKIYCEYNLDEVVDMLNEKEEYIEKLERLLGLFKTAYKNR